MICTGCGTQSIDSELLCEGCGSEQRRAASAPAVFRVGQALQQQVVPESIKGRQWFAGVVLGFVGVIALGVIIAICVGMSQSVVVPRLVS